MSYPANPDDAGQGSYYGPPPAQEPGYEQSALPQAGYPQQYPQTGGYQQPGYPQPYPQAPYPQQAYGYPTPYPGQVVVTSPSNGLGVAGFVTGLLGLIFCWVPFFGLVLGLLGVILGGAGISSGKRTGASNGLAIAGLVLGIISLVPAILIIAAVSSV